jgi:DNA-binding response OmpR family regulator
MTAPSQNYILYLGRPSATSETLRVLLQDLYAPPAETPALELVTNQKVALRSIHAQPPTLVLVETTGKPESRLRFCEGVRLRLPTVPIIAVGLQSSNGYVYPFDAVVPTPVEPEQALAALRHISSLAHEPTLQRGPIQLNLAARRVSAPSGEHVLTPKLALLLQVLMEQEGRVVRRADLMQRVWETSYLDDTRTLDVHVRWLRQMIEPDPASPIYLQTKRGEGYLFTVPDDW